MKKTLQSLCLLLAVLLAAALPAAAADKQKLAAAYVQAQTLYVYYENGELAPQLNGRAPEQTVRLADAGDRVTYVLAVDRSGSTRAYLDAILQMVDALDEATPGCVFRLCGFSDNFSADSAEYDADALKTALRGLTFQGNTDIFYGLSQAAQALTDSQWSAGELYSLILLTDGWSSGAESEPPVFASPASFLLHTYVLGGGGSPGELAQLQQLSNGAFLSGGSGADAGAAIAGRTGGLTAYTFPLEAGDTEPYKLFFTRDGSPEITSLSGVHVAGGGYAPSPSQSGEDLPAVTDAPPAASSAPAVTDAPPAASPVPGAEATPSASAPPADDPASQSGQPDPEAPAAGLSAGLAAALTTILLLLAVIAVLAVLLLRRRRSAGRSGATTPGGVPAAPTAPPHTPATVAQPGAIPLKLELLNGQAVTRQTDFYLKDWLLIGSDKSCDLVLDDPEVAPRNSRIFFREGYLYIEDLGSPAGTALGGMRLHAPNRLRSGDEISIGDVLFRFTF